jgi:hypothetical protein
MIRVDARVARALAHLNNPEMKPLVDFLKAQRLDVLEQLTKAATDVQIYRLQGEAELLREFLELIEGAEALLSKLKQ